MMKRKELGKVITIIYDVGLERRGLPRLTQSNPIIMYGVTKTDVDGLYPGVVEHFSGCFPTDSQRKCN